MAVEYASMLSKHAFFKGLRSEVVDLVAGCAQEIEFSAGQYICHEDDQADQFYVLVHGHVALQIASPGRGARTFLTIGAGGHGGGEAAGPVVVVGRMEELDVDQVGRGVRIQQGDGQCLLANLVDEGIRPAVGACHD